MRKKMQQYWSQQHGELIKAIRLERQVAADRGLNCIADLPSLVAQLAHPSDAAKTWGSNDLVDWRHDVWAVNPDTGHWYLAVHTWSASPKARAARRGPQKCLVCSGDVIDGTTSVQTFMPALAREYADPRVPFANVPIGLHSAGKKWMHLADVKGFATLQWLCKTHGKWSATMNNRTAEHGGTGCPKCGPRSVSKEQIRVACHIRSVLPTFNIDPGPIEVPTKVRMAANWGTGAVLPDMLLDAPRVVVEYDGQYGHASNLRPDAAERVRRQTAVFLMLGYHVIRLSIVPHAQRSRVVTAQRGKQREVTITLPSSDPHAAAVGALEALEELTAKAVPRLAKWRKQPDPIAQADASQEIARLWGASGKKRRQRGAKGRISRTKHIAPGTPFGHLTVTNSPAKFSGVGRGAKDHLVPCRCDCGAEVYVPAVDLRRTRNPQRHCNRSCPLIPAPKFVALRTGESSTRIRLWARQQGITIGRSGRIPAHIVELFRESQQADAKGRCEGK